MKITKIAAAVAMAGCLAAPAMANQLTFQNVTFAINSVDSNTFNLTITNALNANGDWKGIEGLASFEIKTIGAVSNLDLTGWTDVSKALSANGCASGNSTGGCFTHDGGAQALSNNMSFNIDYTGTLDLSAPHLKVLFTGADQGNGHGNLLSQTVPVPEPSTYALMLAGLGIVGFMGRRRNKA